MAVRSPCPDINIPKVSFPDLILNKIKRFPGKIAFIDDATGRTMTFGEFYKDVHKLARSLHSIGLEKNDAVVLFLPNIMEYAVIMYGVLLAGGTIEIFTVRGKIDGIRSYGDLLKLGCDHELPKISVVPEEDAAFLIYTSGSTGERKATIHTHYSTVASILQICSPMVTPYTGNDVTFVHRSVTHGYGLIFYFTAGLYSGCTSVFLDDYGTESLLKAIEKYKVTLLAFTPLDIALLCKYPDACRYDVSSIKTVLCSGAPLSNDLLEKFKTVYKIEDVRDTFGMTELFFVLTSQVNKPHMGVGIPLPNIEFKIAPREVEDVIQALPGVESVVVIGIPHEDYNEIPKAFVVKQPGSSITEEDITRIVEESLDIHRRLKGGVEFLEKLPKTDTGKVLRRLVKENVLAKLKNSN
ncbi:hypothetical protein LSH36_296g00025 [Paralvinella palmiformis]|uniref:AMP-dependent synthetase/ligase domain-containing protein n=1 Tax=Paralvinella palmiformis TaxID=53620 RepID=A0AAD9JIL4_9ANNE|nr:hypothetical protein LSH36_296g00025 [Paralvinella palmiformis]